VSDPDDTIEDAGVGDGPFEDHLLRVGADVCGYVIDGELGRGGMGIVYSAQHPVIGKRVAIKVLKPALSERPASVERFVHEAKAVNAIGHPNIVDIFAFGALPDGRRYLVMDLLQGESLRVRLARGTLDVREAAHVLDEIASALVATHDKGFIHRDLKPDNVFLVEHVGRVDIKLLDFGLAKLLPSAGQRAYRTLTGAQIGTPDYMSPEQLRGSAEVDARSDIYALGVVAIETLSGRRPRRRADGTFDEGPAEDLLAAVEGLPSELVRLIAAMVAIGPADRPSLAAARAVFKRIRSSFPALSSLRAKPPGLAGRLPEFRALAPAARQDPPAAWIEAAAQVSSPRPHDPATPVTKVGVPPPPRRVPQSQRAPAATARERGGRAWLIAGAVLVIAGVVALAVVLAS
jgi:serine/threonine-protein kinase